MAATPTHPHAPRKGMAPRPPRIIINTPPYGAPNRLSQVPFSANVMPPFTANTMPPYTASTMPPFTAATNATLPNTVGAPMWPPYATSYFTKGFEGFRDFAKTGLSSGEKIAYWIYDKFSKLSKKWFTHFFLFTVVLLYSAVGAVIFQAIEGPSEKREMENIRGQRDELLAKLRLLSLDNEMLRDPDGWEGRALAYIREYKHVLVDSFRDEAPKMKWSFWNTMFYCGTIYTTIDITGKLTGWTSRVAPRGLLIFISMLLRVYLKERTSWLVFIIVLFFVWTLKVTPCSLFIIRQSY